jgi:thiol-disulfide isomerase/thioredoxin
LEAWLSARSAAELAAVVTGVAAVGLALLSLRLWLDNRRLKRELHAGQRARLIPGPPVGAPAPSFALPEVGGRTQSLQALRSHGRPIALVFMDPGCGPCRALLPDLKRWQLTLSQALTIAIISRASDDQADPASGQDGVANVLLQRGSEVSDAYRVKGTPSAIVVSPNGTIASSPAAGAAAIEALIRVTLRRQQPVLSDAAVS